MKVEWINRIICGVVCGLSAWICEKYNLRPALCFILAFCTMVGLAFIFEIVNHLFKGGE